MNVELHEAAQRPLRWDRHLLPKADNDDDPLDPPPARALRAPGRALVTLLVADALAADATMRAA
jgi:hypothetical protein